MTQDVTPDEPGAGIEQLGYEQARAELAEIVRALETGGQSLEESLALWQRGEKLADVCQGWLDGARQRLDAAIEERDGDSGRDGDGTQTETQAENGD